MPQTTRTQSAAPSVPLRSVRQEAADSLAGAALGLLGCNACEVYLREESTHSYASAATASDREALGAGAPLPATVIEDFFLDPIDVLTVDDTRALREPLKSAATRLNAASALILRVRQPESDLAIIVCGYRMPIHLSSAGSFTPACFARTAAGMLDLARRTETALDRADRLAALLDSSARLAAELDLETLLRTIHEEVCRHMEAPSFCVALAGDEGRLRTEYAVRAGARTYDAELPGGATVAERVRETGQPLILTPAGGGSLLAVPMRLGEQIVGVMAAASAAPAAYDERHAEFLSEVADQAAVAIHNAGLLREERRRAAELSMLHRVAVVAASETDVERLLGAVVVEAASAFHADAASVALPNAEGDFELAAAFGLSEEYRRRRVLPGDWLRGLYGEPPHERFIGPDELERLGQPELLAAEGIRSLYLVPLVAHGKLVGSLALHGRNAMMHLSGNEARLAQVFADHIAVAVERARARQALAEQIEDDEVLVNIGRILVAGPGVDYAGLLDILRRRRPDASYAIFSLRGEPAVPVREAAVGSSFEAVGAADISAGKGLLGSALAGETIYVADLASNDRRSRDEPAQGSLACYPLRVSEGVQGILAVHVARVNALSARDRRLLDAVASHLALALSNARLHAAAAEQLSRLMATRAQLEERTRFLERRQSELKLIGSVAGAVNATLHLPHMLGAAAERIARGLERERCIIALADESPGDLEIAADHASEGAQTMAGARYVVKAESAVMRSLEERGVYVTPDAVADPALERQRQFVLDVGLRSCAFVAIRSECELLGLLVVGDASPQRPFSPDEIGVLATLANQLALGIRNARLYERARRRANEDSLTGLFNHRYLHGRLEQELERSRRSNQPLALCLFDLDKLKTFNDTYGHQAGDEVLRFIATVLQQSLRSTDVAGRYGGDEFLVILPQSDEQGAQLLLERLRRRIEEQAGAGLLPMPIEFSAGIAVYPRDGATKNELIAHADAAMYAHKRRPTDTPKSAR
jgi:diguanylate cyclase (GGDEF)-like protein